MKSCEIRFSVDRQWLQTKTKCARFVNGGSLKEKVSRGCVYRFFFSTIVFPIGKSFVTLASLTIMNVFIRSFHVIETKIFFHDLSRLVSRETRIGFARLGTG